MDKIPFKRRIRLRLFTERATVQYIYMYIYGRRYVRAIFIAPVANFVEGQVNELPIANRSTALDNGVTLQGLLPTALPPSLLSPPSLPPCVASRKLDPHGECESTYTR